MNRLARLGSILVVVVLLAGMPGIATAYGVATSSDTLKGNVTRWAVPEISYYLDAAGTNGLGASQAQQCMKDSFNDWQNVDCTALRFTYEGTTTNRKVLPMSSGTTLNENGRNELVWINDRSWTFGAQVLGVTMGNGSWNYSGIITESDIAFNGFNYNWNDDGYIGYWGNDMDCKSVVIHEIGHMFGLQHVLSNASQSDPPTMAPSVDPEGRSASLSRDDQLGACFLYPETEYYECGRSIECPKVIGRRVVDNASQEYEVGQIACSGGYCQGGGGVAPDSVDLGGTCRVDKDCVAGATCRLISSISRMCTRPCSTASDDCPDGFHCDVPAGDTEALCMTGSKKKGFGETCATTYECAAGLCFSAPDYSGKTCRQSCPKDSMACPAGQICWANSFSSTGGCYPADQVSTAIRDVGAECALPSECKSGICYGEPGDVSRCRTWCGAGNPACETGYACRDLGTYGACVPADNRKDDGATCVAAEECRSQACVRLVTAGASYCRTSCDLQTWQCATGTSCVSYGSASTGVCMPSDGRKATGEACTANEDCISTMCVDFGAAGRLCTQNCVDGWCPNDGQCRTGDAWGDLCAPPENVPVEEDKGGASGDDVPQVEDQGGTVGDDLPQAEEQGEPFGGDVPVVEDRWESAGDDVPSAGDQGPAIGDEVPQAEDRGGTTGEDIPRFETDSGVAPEDSGSLPPPPVPSKSGCSSGAVPGSVPFLPLLAALGAFLLRRRRA